MYKDGYQWIKELSMKDKLKQIGESIEIYNCDFWVESIAETSKMQSARENIFSCLF